MTASSAPRPGEQAGGCGALTLSPLPGAGPGGGGRLNEVEVDGDANPGPGSEGLVLRVCQLPRELGERWRGWTR